MWFVPQNEQGVILLFGYLCALKDDAPLVNYVQAEFPDAEIEMPGGDTFRVEFEYKASNFIAHKHDARECDVVICYINDLDDSDFPLPIITLRNELHLDIAKANAEVVELWYWKNRAKRAERELAQIRGEIYNLKENSDVSNAQDVNPPIATIADWRAIAAQLNGERANLTVEQLQDLLKGAGYALPSARTQYNWLADARKATEVEV